MKEERQHKKSITEILHEIISGQTIKDKNNEFSGINVENDMVNSFFDNIHKFSDEYTASFAAELENDLDNITQVVYSSANDLAIFYTYLTMMIRRLPVQSKSFESVITFCKGLARDVIQSKAAPKDDFMGFFIKHLYRCYVAVMKEDPNKRQAVAELIMSHTEHDLSLRIKVVQDLKKYIKEEETLYCCLAYIQRASLEVIKKKSTDDEDSHFNEEWFDVFLYYALVGLGNGNIYVRVFSVNLLNTICEFNIDGILDVTEKVRQASNTDHWELKA